MFLASTMAEANSRYINEDKNGILRNSIGLDLISIGHDSIIMNKIRYIPLFSSFS